MENKNFIDTLSYNNANYNNPEQAITTANLCETISRDINTDSQRFIYELLQNADDASNNGGYLDIHIEFVDEYIIVSHNGERFSKIDIESISSAGDGTKAGDSSKTGFKGIGFKSVFSHSNFVIIKSGDYCFKFDQHHWAGHWNDVWGSKSAWENERRAKNKDENLKMPWQIIPIWTELPVQLMDKVLSKYTVSTIIRYDKIEKLKKALNDLFSESQIILFLRSKRVKVIIDTEKKLELEKSVSGDVTYLKRNGVVLSEWLVKTESFPIPDNVQIEINTDEKSPKKLKEAKQTEISFAIQLDKGKLKPVDKENRLIYTYLPTSINYDLPFLVNASFLTDAGRQHIHQDTFWNQWLFNQIPIMYFRWISELASKNSKYNRQFLTVIPQKLNGFNELEKKFNEGYDLALQTIAFIPNLQGDLLKVADALYDETNISEFISKKPLLNFLNVEADIYSGFAVTSFIPDLKPISTLKMLGVYTFSVDMLKGFFTSFFFLNEHKVGDNFKLISYLYQQSNVYQKSELKSDWMYQLKSIPFIFDENEILMKPELIYFPAVEFSEDFENDISIINETVLVEINNNLLIRNWLEELGVREPTDINFIEKTIIGDDEFIKEENAIAIGRYLFSAHKKGILSDHHYSNLHDMCILTQQGTLKRSQDCFLSDFYEPELKLEKVSDIDFFISEEYFEKKDLKSEWKTFFSKIGIKEDVEWTELQILINEEEQDSIDKNFFKQIPRDEIGKKYSNGGYWCYCRKYIVHHFSYFKHSNNNYHFSKIFWARALSSVFNNNFKDIIKADTSFYGPGGYGAYYSIEIEEYTGEKYFQWTINNINLFPTTNKECRTATQVINNSIPQIKEIAGSYLPILDYDGIVSPDWLTVLKFKEQLKLDDYLDVLSQIWQDTELPEEEQKENKKRVLLIYEKLAELLPNLHANDKIKLEDWCKSNKLLARDSKFYLPNELSIVSIEGFNADNLIYTENKVESNILSLFEFLGVKVIDKVTPKFSNSMVSQESLRKQLEYIAPLIALVSVEKSRNKKEWENEYNRICNKLSGITFFETKEILLTYGNELDQQQRSTYSEGNKFYYIGNCYKPRVLDGLIEPLCKFLNIRYAERILTVLLTDVFEEGLKYLEEKGFDISLIPENLKNPEIEERTPNQTNRHYNQSDEDLGKKGEMIVFEELKQIYFQKYKQPIISTDRGFRIDGSVDITWRNKSENTTANHDFKIIEGAREIYIDSKATVYNKNVEKVALYISGRELDLMEKAEKYLIARVYNAMSDDSTVEFIKMQLDNVIE